MKPLKISELKNSTPIDQLLTDLLRNSSHNQPDKATFATMLKSNFGFMYIDEIRRIFKLFDSGGFTAETDDTHTFNEWFCRVIAGHKKFKEQTVKEVYRPADHNLHELFQKMWDESIKISQFQFRPDVAVYGYDQIKQRGEIPNVEIEKSKEFKKLEGKFLQAKRDNGATLYNLTYPLNMEAYKRHVKIEIFKNYFTNFIKTPTT